MSPASTTDQRHPVTTRTLEEIQRAIRAAQRVVEGGLRARQKPTQKEGRALPFQRAPVSDIV